MSFVIKLPKTAYYLAASHRGVYGYTPHIEKALKLKTFAVAEMINTLHKGEMNAIN